MLLNFCIVPLLKTTELKLFTNIKTEEEIIDLYANQTIYIYIYIYIYINEQ